MFKIIEKSKIFFIISAALIVATIVLLIVPGLNLGLDFTVGANITIESDADLTEAKRTEIGQFIKDEGFVVSLDAGRSINNGKGVDFNLELNYQGEEKSTDDFNVLLSEGDNCLINKLVKEFDEIKDAENVTVTITSPDSTKSLTRNAIIAIVVAIIGMLIYIGFRFRFTSGLSAVIVLTHDVMVMLGLTAFAGIFGLKVNLTFIAAVITVIGYSINATIIVFDRIKENLAKYEGQGMTDADVANISIKETIRRTIFTTVTTLIMIVLIAIFGESTIREFAMPIIFGLLSGVYSAIILSSCVWVQVRKFAAKFAKNKKTGYQAHAKEKTVKEA